MALRELFVGIGAMVPLAAAAGCGSATQQVQTSAAPSTSAAPGASAPAQGAPPNAQPRQGFIPALLGNGTATHFFVQSGTEPPGPVPSGTTCSGRVSWNGPNAGSRALATTSNPSWDLQTPAGATRVTWHADCSQLDHSQGVPILRSQAVEKTFTATPTGSSARNAQP
jgi:hypothetical protein